MHSEFGNLDILVANAGYLKQPASIPDTDADNWWALFEVNVRGTFNTIRAFMPFSRTGVVDGTTLSKATTLNISSGAGHLPSIKPLECMSAYAASKIAGAKMVEYIGSEVPGLRVVNVQPGSIASDISGMRDGQFAYDDPKLPGDFCVWLASSEAELLHGRFVWANWDVDVLKARAAEVEISPRSCRLYFRVLFTILDVMYDEKAEGNDFPAIFFEESPQCQNVPDLQETFLASQRIILV